MTQRGYHERIKEQEAGRQRRAEERREDKAIHADAVISRYHDACTECYPKRVLPQVEYIPNTGRYRVKMLSKWYTLTEKQMNDVATNMYAAAHERELGE